MKFLSAPIRYQIMMLFGHDDDGINVCVCRKTRMLAVIIMIVVVVAVIVATYRKPFRKIYTNLSEKER